MADLLLFPKPGHTPRPDAKDAARNASPALADAEARRAAVDIQRSWIVEAPAGSGKTGLLIQRLLKLLAKAEIERPGEILAITFTRKAAAELRARVLEQLAEARAQTPLPPTAGEYDRTTRGLAEDVLARDESRGWRLLESPHQLNIRTIDSFCGELAGALPLLSGGAGRRQPVADAKPLYELAAERALRELGGPDPLLSEAIRCVLLHRDAQIGDCTRLMAEMLAAREQWGELVPLGHEELSDERLDQEVRPRLERALERVVCAALQRAADAISPKLLQELARFAARLGAEPGYREGPSPIAFCDRRPHPPGTASDNLEHWLALLHLLMTKSDSWRLSFARNTLGFELPKTEAPWLKELIAHLKSEDERRPGLHEALCALRCLPPTCYPDDHWRVAKALFRLLRRALLELQLLFAERGVCDFTETALTARSLLRDNLELLNTPGLELKHLLVDEMQDTSAGQYELLELLTRSWDGATQTIFLVGDPKQSIYAFRQARVERFLRTAASGRLGDMPLGSLRLTANFRSQAELVHAFNTAFAQILGAPGDTSAGPDHRHVPFVAATPVRPPAASPALFWHPRLDRAQADDRNGDQRATSASTAAQSAPGELAGPAAEAWAIRQTIEDFLGRWAERPLPPGTTCKPPRIAVLARSRAHLAPVIAEFQRDRGDGPLPFRAVEIELLDERSEVLDLLALTRALLHPGDRVAWLAVLHAPVCGLGLADLLALTGEGPEADPAATVPHLVATRSHRLSSEGQPLLRRAWSVLSEARAGLGRTLLSTTVERTWRSLGGDAPLGQAELANARRFLDLLRELETEPEPLSLALLNRRLGRLYANSAAPSAVVELLTMHKAKGLEWDLVLLPALERGAGASRHDLLEWLELDGEQGAEADVILAPIQGKGEESTALSTWLLRQGTARETAEAKRLFYVACTRAREELHLFAACSFKNGGTLALPRHDSLLRASWTAAEPALLAQLTASDTVSPAPGIRGPGALRPARPRRRRRGALAAGGARPKATAAPGAPPAARLRSAGALSTRERPPAALCFRSLAPPRRAVRPTGGLLCRPRLRQRGASGAGGHLRPPRKGHSSGRARRRTSPLAGPPGRPAARRGPWSGAQRARGRPRTGRPPEHTPRPRRKLVALTARRCPHRAAATAGLPRGNRLDPAQCAGGSGVYRGSRAALLRCGDPPLDRGLQDGRAGRPHR